MGSSSPESQLIVQKRKSDCTSYCRNFKRTGDDETDKALAIQLEGDEKENAEHVMLACIWQEMNLSRMCNNVEVTQYKKIHYYSHVIHLVSDSDWNVGPETNPFKLIATTFPCRYIEWCTKI